MITFSFIYQGEIEEDADAELVQQKLAQLFSVNEIELAGLFNGKHFFRRDDLDHITANGYKAAFAKAGAIGKVMPTPQAKSEPISLPVSQPNQSADKLTSNPTTEQTTAAATEQTTTSEHDSSSEYQLQGDSDEVHLANKWLKWSSIAIVSTIIADRQLQSSLIIDTVGMDIGYLPLIIAHIGLLIGCFLFVKAKNLSWIYGLLGLFSVAGLSILILISDQHEHEGKRPLSVKRLAFTGFCCVLVLFWVSGFWSASAGTEEFFAQADTLYKEREEYPSTRRQNSEQVYQHEQDELAEFMAQSLDMLNTESFRPDDAEKVSQRIFQEFARYEIWRNYQEYLHIIAKKRLPSGLTESFSNTDRTRFAELLKQKITSKSHARLKTAQFDWFVGKDPYSSRYSQEDRAASKFGRFLTKLFDSFNEARFAKLPRYGQPKKPIDYISVEDIHIPEYPGTTLKKYDQHIEYIFNQGPYQGKRVAIGFYFKPYLDRQKKPQTLPQILVLSHEFPAKYITQMFSAFDRYDDHIQLQTFAR